MTNARQARTAREKSAALQAEAAQAAARRRVIGIAGAVIAALVVGVGATVMIRTAQDNAEKNVAVVTPANLVSGAYVDGKEGAPVDIRIYEDFLCPACGQFEAQNKEQLAGWAADGTARVEYRPIAILDRLSTDGYSTRAANAAAVVADKSPGNWLKFHSLLFENQPAEGGAGLSDDQLVELAVQAGATEADVRPGIEGKTFSGWVTQQTEAARTGPDKVTGTPTVLVNGELVKNWSTAQFKATVEEAAAK